MACITLPERAGAFQFKFGSEIGLVKVDAAEGAKYKNVNSAQVIPEKQGWLT